MKLNPSDENIIRNLKSQSTGKIVGYIFLGLSGFLFITLWIKPGILVSGVLFLSGLITGFAIEKYYSGKVYALCVKLYNAIRLR